MTLHFGNAGREVRGGWFDRPVEDAGVAAVAVLVIGFGNVLLGDDGAGVRLVDRLGRRIGPGVCTCIDGGTMSFTLLPYVEAARSLLLVDAAELHEAPGALRLYENGAMDDFLKSRRRRTVHEVGLTDLLDMARLRDCLPATRALLCIQPGAIDWSEALSPPVAAALQEGVGRAASLIARWTAA